MKWKETREQKPVYRRSIGNRRESVGQFWGELCTPITIITPN